MRTWLLLAILLFCPLRSWAVEPAAGDEEALTPETIQICNQVMSDIYQHILQVRDRYKELAQFNEEAFFKNKQGIYTIAYDQVEEVEAPDGSMRKKVPFSFGVTIEPTGSETFSARPGSFAYGFPALGLKFSGYQNKRLLRTQFDLIPLLGEHGQALNEYQQQFLPLQLTVRPLKEEYQVREDIEVEVVLTNVSLANIRVQDLSEDTLFFTVNGRFWGTSLWTPPQVLDDRAARRERRAERREAKVEERNKRLSKRLGGAKIKKVAGLLNAGDSISLILKGESFPAPQEVEVQCTYSVLVKDVNPMATMRFKIVE